MTKTCDNCGKQYQPLRSNSKFCSPNCRVAYFRKRQADEIIVPKKEQTKDLTGLTTTTTVTKELIPVTEQLNPVYELHADIYNETVFLMDGFRNKRQQIVERYYSTLQKDFGLDTALIAGILGGIVGYTLTPQYTTETVKEEKDGETVLVEKTVRNSDSMFGLGLGIGVFAIAGYVWGTMTGNEKLQRILSELKNEIAYIDSNLQSLETQKQFEISVLEKTSKYISLNTEQYEKVNNTSTPVQNEVHPFASPALSEVKIPPKETPAIERLIIPATDLIHKTFQVIPFQEPYRSLIGEPPFGFHAIIYGLPGQGKSTFAIQFANYLALNHGRVLYISAEEGHEKSLVDKIKQQQILSNMLDIADVSNAETVSSVIRNAHYPFIFIDSADRLGLSAKTIQEIKTFSKSSLIVIHQSTKSGEMKGVQELKHDADIVIAVDQYQTSTVGEKNRYGVHNTVKINPLS